MRQRIFASLTSSRSAGVGQPVSGRASLREAPAQQDHNSDQLEPLRSATWRGKRDVRVHTVPDPAIKDATEVTVQITSPGNCGSDLHL
jgi:hypothetical protein